MIAHTKAQLSEFKIGKKLFQFMRYDILKIANPNSRKFEFDCKDFLIIFFAYYDSFLPIDSDEIIKRLSIWLNNPQCVHKEGLNFTFFW